VLVEGAAVGDAEIVAEVVGDAVAEAVADAVGLGVALVGIRLGVPGRPGVCGGVVVGVLATNGGRGSAGGIVVMTGGCAGTLTTGMVPVRPTA
jgi:hypothetical protein